MGQQSINIRKTELMPAKSEFAEQIKKDLLAKCENIQEPKERDEEWRYTNIEKLKLSGMEYNGAAKIHCENLEFLKEKEIRLTDINSALEHDLQSKLYFARSKIINTDKFAAIAAAKFTNGYFLFVPANIELTEPIKISIDIDSDCAVYNLIVIGENSRIKTVEEYSNAGKDEKASLILTEINQLGNSCLDFSSISSFTNNFAAVHNMAAKLKNDSRANFVSACFGGKLNRMKIDTIFDGKGSSANNLGIFLGRGKEHIDFTTNMFHNFESTTNDVLVDGILKDSSTSVYRGLIQIPKEGQKTNSYLANHILKMGEKTLANSIPSLKIDANDVKASHGATVGQLNEEHLFYLMARGLSRNEAEKMIIEGFFEPIIEKIPSEELREKIRVLVSN